MNSLRILVVEDKEIHRKSAEETLAGHSVTIVKSFDEAMVLMNQRENSDVFTPSPLKPFAFDVVLTDMMMPVSEKEVNPRFFNPGEQASYGFVIALKAAAQGAKYVAMVTDTNHHEGAMSAAIDHLSSGYYGTYQTRFVINGASVVFVHSPFTKEWAKDWGQVLKDLIT